MLCPNSRFLNAQYGLNTKKVKRSKFDEDLQEVMMSLLNISYAVIIFNYVEFKYKFSSCESLME